MYYFIVNPHSRSGHGMDIWKKAKEFLDEKEVEYTTYFTEYIGHAQKLAKQIADLSEPCTLGVLGGDGTLNEVINGLAPTDYSHITLGYIPTGSGNDFARGLRLSTDIETCVNAILSPSESTSVDIGLAKTEKFSRYFLVSSGLGYDADICYHVSHSPFKKILNKLHIGKLIYVMVALKLLITYKPCPVSVRLDQKEISRFQGLLFVAGMNLKNEGGGVKFCPDASFDDGLLDICLVEKLPRLKILALFPSAFTGRHTRFKGVHMMRCKSIDIISKASLPLHCDGEIPTFTDRVTLTVSDKQINVILK